MKWVAVASLTAVVGLAATASALAARSIPHSFRHFEIPAAVYLGAHADAGGGYELRLTGYHVDLAAQEGEPATTSSYVQLELAKPGASAEYSSRERHFDGDGSVEADWGARGRVAARFVPRRVHRERVPWCEGSSTVETGLLVGRLSFHGEGGYATVRSNALPATLTRQPKMTCHIPPTTDSQGGHESSSVSGSSARHGRQLGVSAELHPGLGTLTLSAYSAARRDGIRVTRWVSAVAPLAALATNSEAETATLTAPSPFTGTATFDAFPGKEAGTWRGDLSVDFPGEPGVRLAGKRFQGAKLKPGECGPDEANGTCISAKLRSPIGLKPALPLAGDA